MSANRTVLVDIAGVLHVGDVPVPGAAAGLQRLRTAGVKLRFLTNTTRRTRQRLADDLCAMGLQITAAEIVTAASAARDYVVARGLHPYLLIHPGLADEFSDLSSDTPDCVLLGDAADGFDYGALDQCFRVLMENPDRPLIAMAKNRYFRGDDGLHLDMGPFVAALEYASRREAIVTGKPAEALFRAALDAVGAQAADAVMIGDDIEADIGGAAAAGIRGILVRTGKFQARDEGLARAGQISVEADFAAAVDSILGGEPGPQPGGA